MSNEHKIDETEVNRLSERYGAYARRLKEARAFAYRLVQEGNRDGFYQIRGSLMGIAEQARLTEEFLTGLLEIVKG